MTIKDAPAVRSIIPSKMFKAVVVLALVAVAFGNIMFVLS